MGAENSKPVLHLAPELELNQRVNSVSIETRLSFSYLGHLHLREELRVLLNKPLIAENWDNKRVMALAEVMQLAEENLQPIYDHIAYREQKAVADNRNHYVLDKIAALSLITQTIAGSPPSATEVFRQVAGEPEQLDSLLYIAERLTQHNNGNASLYTEAAFGVLSELSKRRNKGYTMFPSEVSRGFKRVGTLNHLMSTDPGSIFDRAEAWITGLNRNQDAYYYYQTIASGMINCNLIERAIELASKLQKSKDIKVRHTANEIYEETAMKLASEGKFDKALEVQKMTRGSRNSLQVTIYGDRAVYEALQGNDPYPVIEHLEEILAPSSYRRPYVRVKGLLRIGLARFRSLDFSGAENSWQKSWELALQSRDYPILKDSQVEIAEMLDDAGYDTSPLFVQAMQQDNIPEAAINHHRMKILQKLAARGYFDVASQFLNSARPSGAANVTDLTDLAKVELQQTPSSDELKNLNLENTTTVLKERSPLLDMAMLNLGLLQNLDEDSMTLWAHGIFPSKSILTLLKQGIQIEELLKINKQIELGGFNPNDFLHRELQYRRYLEACKDGTITPSADDFRKISFRDEIDDYQLSFEEEKEADAAAYEAAKVYWLISDRVNYRRNIVILGNNRYGELFIVRPLEQALQELRDKEGKIRTGYGRVASSSTNINTVPDIFDQQSSLENFIKALQEDDTDLIIVDGSSTKSPGKPRLPKSMMGYLNWVIAYNEAAGVLTQDILEDHIMGLRKLSEFQKLVSCIQSQKPKHGFSISHWTPDVAQKISFGNILDQKYRHPDIVGSEAIFVNPVADMNARLKTPLPLIGHTQGYFDDPDKYIGEEKEIVFTKYGIRLVSKKAPIEEVLVHAVQNRMELVMDKMIILTNPVAL